MKAIKGIHWDLFSCEDTNNGTLQIQRCDDDESLLFKNDCEAVKYVIINKNNCEDCKKTLELCDDRLVDKILKNNLHTV